MKVLGISGSPRKGGNTDTLLDKALEGAEAAGASLEKIVLNDLNFCPCQECGGCAKTGICVVKDEMQAVYEKLREADAVIIASPIFFGSVSAQVKMMIDRLQCLWVAKYVLKRAVSAKTKRKGIFLSVGGSDESEFFDNAKSIIKIFFATLGIKYAGELYYGGLDKKTAIKEEEGALKAAFSLGRSLVEGNQGP